MPQRIYLDHAATTPMCPQAVAAVEEGMRRWANPSSPHAEGRSARAALEDARERIKAALDWNGELVFTSGATEAAALAFRRCWIEGPEPMLSAVEHDAVLRQAAPTGGIAIGVTPDGRVDPDQLASRLKAAPGGLVAIQHVNSETGVIQPIRHIIEVVDAAGSFLLVDCAQSAGKIPLPPADMAVLSAHKFGGPPGIGALLVRDWKLLVPEGGQEMGYRGGTENLPAILGFAAALEARPIGRENPPWLDAQVRNRALFEEAIEAAGGIPVCRDSLRSPFIGSYRMPGVPAAAQLIQLDSAGFAVSAGSACSSGSLKPSHVLKALGWSEAEAGEVIRVSFGFETPEDEILRFAEAWTAIAARRRAA